LKLCDLFILKENLWGEIYVEARIAVGRSRLFDNLYNEGNLQFIIDPAA